MSDDVKKTWEQFVSEYQPPSEAALINDFAIRCFRDTGDGDYIAARLAFKAGLATQAIWSGLQAVEKYLKCMLLLRRISSKGVGHDIAKGLRLVKDRLNYDIVLPDNEQAVFDHLAESCGDRYLVASLHLFDHELSGLDALVWRFRQYCDVLDVEHFNDEPSTEILFKSLERIKATLDAEPVEGHLRRGALETILADQHHRAHEGLVWRNAMFGGGIPIRATSENFNFVATNSPLYLNPNIVRAVSKLVHLPKGALEAFEELAVQRENL